MDRPHVETSLLASLHADAGRVRHHLARFALFTVIYLSAIVCINGTLARFSPHWWAFFLCAPLYLLAAASLHGISLFTHEAVHGTLASNPVLNHVFGAACALPVLQNFAAYRVLHLRHHDHLGLPGDPDHYDNYTRWTWLVFLMHWGRLVIGYPVYITAIPILGFRAGTARDRLWILVEVLAAVLMVISAVYFLPSARLLIHGWLIPMFIINTLVNIRGMSQHTLLELQSDPIRGTRSILTNRVTAFFMCNENYHLEHHLYPGVPWYHLPRLHAEMRDELRSRGAPYIASYMQFVRDFVVGSFRRSPLGRTHSR